jgi:hypothetical protein
MEPTTEQCEILFRAKILAATGSGQVLEPWAVPDAHELAEAGWLERRFTDDGELAWFWAPQGDVALELGALTTGHSPN